MNYIKHPIILGLLTSGLCFLYLKIRERREQQENPDIFVEPPSMKYPIILGILVFLGTTLWQNEAKTPTKLSVIPQQLLNISTSAIPKPTNIKMLGDALPLVFLETQ